MVVCVINEVDLFENETLLAGLDSAMRYLSSLVQAVSRTQSGITFKLLLISLMNIENFRNWFLEAVELALLVNLLSSGLAPKRAYIDGISGHNPVFLNHLPNIYAVKF